MKIPTAGLWDAYLLRQMNRHLAIIKKEEGFRFN